MNNPTFTSLLPEVQAFPDKITGPFIEGRFQAAGVGHLA